MEGLQESALMFVALFPLILVLVVAVRALASRKQQPLVLVPLKVAPKKKPAFRKRNRRK